MMKKATRDVDTESEVGQKECIAEGEGEIKGYRNGRMGHYGGRNVFDEWPFYHIKPEQWSIMCYCTHSVINLPLSGSADTTDRPRWKAGSTWKEKVQLDKMAAESPFGLRTLDILQCFGHLACKGNNARYGRSQEMILYMWTFFRNLLVIHTT